MIGRRELLIGGACLAAAGSAYAMRPRERMSLIGDMELEKTIPESFAGWNRRETDGIVVPQSEDSLTARLYSQTLGRLYVRDDGEFVMLLIAYGDTQSDLLQLHRPEACYPAFGFNVTQSRKKVMNVGHGVGIPSRELTASMPDRIEHITYWTRIGEYLPIDGGEQRQMKLRSQFAGIVPDGVPVRMSSAERTPEASFALNQAFAADLLAATPARLRPALIGTANSTRLADAAA